MRSMTGYSKYTYENDSFRVKIEMKSVNNKNLNLKIKAPYFLNFMENRIKTEFSKIVTRGSVDLRVEFFDKRETGELFSYDKNISNSYMGVLASLEKDYDEKFSNKLDILLRQSNVIVKNEIELPEKEYEEFILSALKIAIDRIVEMKEQEGNRLKDYFKERLTIIEEKFQLICKNKERIVEDYKERLLERLNKNSDDINFDEKDILKEILLFTDKSDISEEVSRFVSHIEQFKLELDSNENAVGKKLDFILQEMFRELNTTGVKCHLYDISKLVVECKNEVEKIREQVMNIE